MDQNNFLNYSNLNLEDSRVFLGARLNYFVNKAGIQLFGKKGLLCSYENNILKIEPSDLDLINGYIKYLLELIRNHRNLYEQSSVSDVNSLYDRHSEQEFFLFNLFTAIINYKNKVLSKKYPEILKQINAAGTIHNLHHKLKSIEKDKGEITFEINGKSVREKDLYVAATFYVINFAFEAVKSNDSQRLSRILISIDDLKSGPSYLSVNGKAGGQKSGKTRGKNKEKARRIFIKNDIYKRCNGKAEAMISELMPILKKNNISVSEATVRTEWIPYFSKIT